MPQIRGLTLLQRELCERLWQCESEEQAQMLIQQMPQRLRKEAQTLMTLILIECLDEEITEGTHCEEARGLLEKYQGSIG